MPNLDKTGPEGKGPRTGRGLGNCGPTDKKNEEIKHPLPPRVASRGLGRGLGRPRVQNRRGNR